MIQPLRTTISSLVKSRALQLAVGIALICIVLQGAGLDPVLRFDRDRINAGHWWLLFSGNFVHLGISHLLMNLAGLALVVALVWQHYTSTQWALVTIFSSLTVGLGLWLLDPQVGWYVGFSGTLHGLILAGVLADLRVFPRSAGLLLALVVAKLSWEQVQGSLPGSESVAGGTVVVNSHLYGAIGGAVMGVALLLWKWHKNKSAVEAGSNEL